MWMLYFHAEAASPCVDAAGGNGDLIWRALEVLPVESSRVNVSEDGTFGHTGSTRDLARREVLLDCRKCEDDIDQLGAGFTNNYALNFLTTLTR